MLNHPKMKHRILSAVMCPNDSDEMAHCVDLDQTLVYKHSDLDLHCLHQPSESKYLDFFMVQSNMY